MHTLAVVIGKSLYFIILYLIIMALGLFAVFMIAPDWWVATVFASVYLLIAWRYFCHVVIQFYGVKQIFYNTNRWYLNRAEHWHEFELKNVDHSWPGLLVLHFVSPQEYQQKSSLVLPIFCDATDQASFRALCLRAHTGLLHNN